MAIMEATDTITLVEGYDAMRIFLETVSRRHGMTDEEIEFIIGALKWADGSPVDPTMWRDWLGALQTACRRRARRKSRRHQTSFGVHPLVTAFRQNCALRGSSAMGLAKLQANSCFRQTLAGYAVENRQCQEDEQSEPRRRQPACEAGDGIQDDTEPGAEALLREEVRTHTVLHQVRMYAQNVKHNQP